MLEISCTSPVLYVELYIPLVIYSFTLFPSLFLTYFVSLFADINNLSFTLIDGLLCASYKLSKFMEFTNIWNHFVCLFARSELDRGQSPPAFLIQFLRVCLCFRNLSHFHIKWSVVCGPILHTHTYRVVYDFKSMVVCSQCAVPCYYRQKFYIHL